MSTRPTLISILLASWMVTSCDPRTAPANEGNRTAASVPTGGACADTGNSCSTPGDFCKKPVGTCNIAGTQGVCAPRPAECDYIHDPVCGCDGRTYGNACFAEAAGSNVRSVGACPPEQPQEIPIPAVQIVPEVREGGVRDYCRLAARADGRDLIVRLRNPTPLGKPPMNLTVGFAGAPPSTAQMTTPDIAPTSSIDIRVPVPNSCSTGDCRFIINLQDPSGGVQAEGSCLG